VVETTFYYVRAESKPDEYEFATPPRPRPRHPRIARRRRVRRADDLAIEPTGLGRLASKYYLRLDTARRFRRLADHETLTVDSVLETVASSAGEFDSVSARSAESDAIDRILDGRDTDLEDGHRKVFAILLAGMADSIPSDLRSDAWVIRQNALRLLAALSEFLDRFAGPAPPTSRAASRRASSTASRGRPSRSPRSTGSAPAAPSASRTPGSPLPPPSSTPAPERWKTPA